MGCRGIASATPPPPRIKNKLALPLCSCLSLSSFTSLGS